MRPWSADFATAVEYQHAFNMWIFPFLPYGKSEYDPRYEAHEPVTTKVPPGCGLLSEVTIMAWLPYLMAKNGPLVITFNCRS